MGGGLEHTARLHGCLCGRRTVQLGSGRGLRHSSVVVSHQLRGGVVPRCHDTRPLRAVPQRWIHHLLVQLRHHGPSYGGVCAATQQVARSKQVMRRRHCGRQVPSMAFPYLRPLRAPPVPTVVVRSRLLRGCRDTASAVVAQQLTVGRCVRARATQSKPTVVPRLTLSSTDVCALPRARPHHQQRSWHRAHACRGMVCPYCDSALVAAPTRPSAALLGHVAAVPACADDAQHGLKPPRVSSEPPS